jgi:hypothetical protein
MLLAGSCARPRPKLGTDALRACLAEGGYESRGGFGEPLCQIRYTDAGKVCLRKSDCEGECLGDWADDPKARLKVGDAAAGKCSAERTTFGCNDVIDDGKVVGGGCTD